MGIAASKATAKWVAANLKQVKVAVNPDIAISFKSACETEGVSMASELSRFMAEYCKVSKKRAPVLQEDVSTRRKRRKLVTDTIGRMKRVRDAEIRYKDNFPENLRGTSMYESTEESISVIEETIELLESIYMVP